MKFCIMNINTREVVETGLSMAQAVDYLEDNEDFCALPEGPAFP